MLEPQIRLKLSDICSELGLSPQFLLELSDRCANEYDTFELPKRGGGKRPIAVPKTSLKNVQRTLLHGFLARVPMPPHVHGCVKGRSVVSNAAGHVNKPFVVSIDLSNFFGSIGFAQVRGIFEAAFNCDRESAETLAKLTIFNDVLPQGAPTSPTLANIAALELDRNLMHICEETADEYGFHYSRYVDDITISGGVDLMFALGKFYRAVEKCGFRANPNKLKIARPNDRQSVTGVVVNQKLNPPKKLVRKIRQQLYFAKKFGVISHCDKRNLTAEMFLQQMSGLIGYVRMSREDLADEFEADVRPMYEAIRAFSPGKDDLKLLMLREMINNEQIASFYIEENFHRAAPTEITLGPKGTKILRAFQLFPQKRWRKFKIADMRCLDVDEDSVKENA